MFSLLKLIKTHRKKPKLQKWSSYHFKEIKFHYFSHMNLQFICIGGKPYSFSG